MDLELGLLQPYWLLLLPLPWLWWRRRRASPRPWPRLMPMVTMRYPPLAQTRGVRTDTDLPASGQRADLLMALAVTLMLLALAQPVRYTQLAEVEQASEPVDLVLVVGTAITMALRDYVLDGQQVDRMTLTRRMLDDFVARYSGSRVGLVILGNPPALWLPLTPDKDIVRQAIGRIRTALGGRLTDMGATLQLVGEQFSAPRETVVLVISDGGLQLGDTSPLDAARELAAAGFTLYVAAIGSSDPNAIESSSGQLIYQPADLPWLQQLAETGGGRMFHAFDAHALDDALRAIEARHRHAVALPDSGRLVNAWYPAPLFLAMLLLLHTAFLQVGNAKTGARRVHEP